MTEINNVGVSYSRIQNACSSLFHRDNLKLHSRFQLFQALYQNVLFNLILFCILVDDAYNTNLNFLFAAFSRIVSFASSITAFLTGSFLDTEDQTVILNSVEAYVTFRTKQQFQIRLSCSKKRLICTKAERQTESRK